MSAQEEQQSSENTEEDWKIFKILCENPEMEPEDVDVATALRSELAALQYKRDRLAEEVTEMRSHLRNKDQRCLELQVEADQLREQAARQSAVIASLKKRIQELEERERNLYSSQGRNEIAIQTLQKDCRFNEERARDLEKKLRNTELELASEEQKKETARTALHDFVRRLAIALGTDVDETSHLSPEMVIHKASELVQETSRLRNKSTGLNDTLGTIELELRSCKDNLERAINDKDLLQRQTASQLLEIDRLRQEKEALEMQSRVQERELVELREKFSSSTRTVGSQSNNIAQLEATICQLRDEVKSSEERCHRLQTEQKNALESFSLLLSTPSRFVESIESVIRDRIRDIMNENRDKQAQLEGLSEKLLHESQQLSRQISFNDQTNARIRSLEEEKNHLENRLHKLESELNVCEHSREGLKRDKLQFMSFLQRLARSLNMDDIAQEVGVELHTESLLLRAEQLARLESDKLVDKTAVVYQLQRRVRTLREQLQRKDLHLDLLRRKLALQEDCVKTKTVLLGERDEAHARIKKLLKQVDKLTLQLSDAKEQIRDLNTQLAEAADYKITALERGRKIEDLQKRLIESESLRTKYNRKVSLLKDQVRTTSSTIEQERSINEHTIQLLRDELARVKDSLENISRRESQLQSFKASVAKILGVVLPMPDYELISRLQKLVDAHHDFTLVSRRYDDPVLRMTSRSPTLGSRYTRTPDKPRYDDSGFTDAADLDDIDELLRRPPT